MINFVQLLINEPATAELDLNQEVDIALQYSIADINDISKRNAAYSKTIIVPGTKRNNFWFGNLFDVNSDFTGFNPNKKTLAKLLINTECVIDGFLQLKKIVKLNNTDPSGNQINYEVVIFNNAVDLMSAIGERTLNQLDLSEYGHTFSAAEIKASWTHTWEDGYVYPMYGLQTTPNQYKPEYFYPAIFYRTVLDQMVRECGYGWTGSLQNNTQFNHEVISYVTDGRPKINDIEKAARSFYIGLSSSQTMAWNLGTSVVYSNQPTSPIPFGLYDLGTSGNNPFGGKFNMLDGFTISFGVDSGSSPQGNGDFFDGDEDNWDNSLFLFKVKKGGKYSIEYNLNYLYQIRNVNTDLQPILLTTGTPFNKSSLLIRISHVVQYKTHNAGPWIDWNTSTYDLNFTQPSISLGASASLPVSQRVVTPEIDLPQGGSVRMVWKATKANAARYISSNFMGLTETWIRFVNTGGGNWIRNSVGVSGFQQNDFIELARYLPDKVKQKDIISDLIKRYNLFIQTDPDNPRMLIFDTRPDFYARGTILDWTDKKDFSKPDEITLLGDLQSKLMTWSYKADSDPLNKNYTDVTGDVYGQYKYFFDNDFVKGEKKIESQFSPTPIIKTPFKALVAGIDPEQPKVQPRLFYWGGLRDCDTWYWTYTNPTTGATGIGETFSQYPYAGHFDNPIEPEIDINFGSNKFLYYNDWTFITQNNMFNTYWADYVRQIESGRLLTTYFNLNELDIRFIKDNFYTKIFVQDSYYYINKIIDYKPLQSDVTKVELIKIVDGIRWQPKVSEVVDLKNPNIINNFGNISIGATNILGVGGFAVGAGNLVGGGSEGDVVVGGVLGIDNLSGVVAGAVIGNLNTSAGGLVSGNGNVLGVGDGAVIAGNNNVLSSAAGGSFVAGGDNNILGDSGMVLNGDNNNLTGSGNQVIGGSNNTLYGTGINLIGVSGMAITASDIAYLGSSFSVGTLNGNTTIGGDLGVSGITTLTNLVATDINATNNITAGASITAGTDVVAGTTITAGTDVVAGGVVTAGGDITSGGLITGITLDIGLSGQVGTSLTVGDYLSVGNYLSVGSYISASQVQGAYYVEDVPTSTVTIGNPDFLSLQSTTFSMQSGLTAFTNITGRANGDLVIDSDREVIITTGQSLDSVIYPNSGEISLKQNESFIQYNWTDPDNIFNYQLNKFSINTQRFLIMGTGAKYDSDYSANYDDRSLVDKEYVDNKVFLLSTNNSVTGTFTQSLDSNNSYVYTLTGDTTFGYSNANEGVYNFIVKAGTYSFTLNSSANWQTQGATSLGLTGSFIMNMIYDGTDMWVKTENNYQPL